MHLNHPQTILLPQSVEKLSGETGPWGQKGWGPFLQGNDNHVRWFLLKKQDKATCGNI